MIITIFLKDALQRDLYAILHIPFMQGETNKMLQYDLQVDIVGPAGPTYV